jgi:hypothetical protein
MRMPQRPPLGAGARHALRARALKRRGATCPAIAHDDRWSIRSGSGGRWARSRRGTVDEPNRHPHCSQAATSSPTGQRGSSNPKCCFSVTSGRAIAPARSSLVDAASVTHPPSYGPRSSAPHNGGASAIPRPRTHRRVEGRTRSPRTVANAYFRKPLSNLPIDSPRGSRGQSIRSVSPRFGRPTGRGWAVASGYSA